MADFFQNGVIATLHDLGRRTTADLEQDLKAWSDDRPMSLVIPCLVSDLDGSALERILDELAAVPYLEEVVVGLDQAHAEDFARARDLFSRLPQHHRILWNDGPRLRALQAELEDHDLPPGPPGKGRNVWSCLCLLYTSPSPRDRSLSRMPSSA